jgi:biotin transport system substrate-specific component
MNRINEIKDLVLCAVFACLTSVGAWISIPVGIVPMTLQVLFVYLTGLILRPKLAFFAMALYIIMGIIGLPVFASGASGLAKVLGPAGGYLFGFLFAALFISLIVNGVRSRPSHYTITYKTILTVSALLVGSVTIFTFGAVWGKYSTGLAWKEILLGWVFPFLPGDMIKIAISTGIAFRFWSRNITTLQAHD